MKKIFYSTALKVTAIILFLMFGAAGLADFANVVRSYKTGVISTQEDFNDNAVMYSGLNRGFFELFESLKANEYNIFDENFFKDSGIEYYAENRETEKVITNTDKKDKEYYTGLERGTYFTMEMKNGTVSMEGNSRLTDLLRLNPEFYLFGETEESDMSGIEKAPSEVAQQDKSIDNCIIYMRYSDDAISNMRVEFDKAVRNINSFVSKIPVYVLGLLICGVYLYLVAGRKYDSEKLFMSAIDNVYWDFMFLISAVAAVVYCAAVLYIIDLQDIMNHDTTLFTVSLIPVGAVLLQCMSLVRRIKNHSLNEKWLFGKFVVWIWKKLISFAGKLKNGCRSIKKLMSKNMSYALIMVTALVALFALIFVSAFLGAFIYESDEYGILLTLLLCAVIVAAIAVAVFKAVEGYDGIRKGLSKIKNGEVNYKIDIKGGIITLPIAEDINTIGEGFEKAVKNSVKAESMKAELITNVSHDLKTPLTSIINYTELLAKEKLIPEEANDYVKIIEKKSRKLKQLTSDLFDISKVSSGNEEINWGKIDYKLLITQAVAELDKEIDSSGLDFILKFPDEDIYIEADGKKLSRVYENLIINAVKYSLKGTRVYIELMRREDQAVAEIKNISAEKLEFDENEITERFVRGDKSRSGDGNGLGLAIAKSYVELMNGDFKVKTDGDMFKVILKMKYFK